MITAYACIAGTQANFQCLLYSLWYIPSFLEHIEQLKRLGPQPVDYDLPFYGRPVTGRSCPFHAGRSIVNATLPSLLSRFPLPSAVWAPHVLPLPPLKRYQLFLLSYRLLWGILSGWRAGEEAGKYGIHWPLPFLNEHHE